MKKNPLIDLKKVYKFSQKSLFVLWPIMILSTLLDLISIMRFSILLYTGLSLVFSACFVMLIFRNNQINSNSGSLMQIIGITGAIVSLTIWSILIYPISLLLQAVL